MPGLRRLALAAALTVATALPALADAATDALFDALGIDRIVPVVSAEGVLYAIDLEGMMFPGRGGDDWIRTAERIHDETRLEDRLRSGFAAAIDPAAVAPLTEFFTAPAGQDIVAREIEARIALADDAMEDAALEAWREMQGADDPRVALIEDFVAANDLVEANVAGAMNSNLAFWRGLADGGAEPDLTEDEMLSRVWAQEGEIRADTEEWITAYSALAYGGLSEDTLAAYVALSRTPEGRSLNAALFAAFDALFEDMSNDLGRAAAKIVSSEDI